MPDFHDDVFFAGIAELNRRLKAKEFSAVELTRAFLDRLEKLGPRLNALALSLREPAVRDARDVDSDLKRGRFRGPLQGIPFGAKDLFIVAGKPTAWGAPPYSGQVFDYTATPLKKLDHAGAVLLGKLAMVELAGGGGYRFAAASITGPALNPWNRERWAGGSSSGSGAAVAAGLVPFALGSDLGLHPHSRRLLRRHRPASYLRLRQPLRRHGALLDHGQGRPPGPFRRGLRPGAPGDRRR